ncbi:hypothetical protein J4402_04655 [Candidatus Pacearchaeota archaeon]|nr:hypothetical protein [Candidatus Pacearchaeota archaeon]
MAKRTKPKIIRGKFKVNNYTCGPEMDCPGATRTGPDRKYMDPKFGHNYIVTEQLKGEGLTEEDYTDARTLANTLLNRNPRRNVKILVEVSKVEFR